MSQPTNPFTELTHAFERMQEQFEEIARNWNEEPLKLESSMSPVNVDLEDRDEELVLTAELPGFDPEDIEVRVTDRTLRLEAEYEETKEYEESGEYIRQERHRASAVRSVSLPEPVETDDILASYENGVLTVRMPKSEPVTKGTKIDIN